jgi:hypothetical protein
MAIASGGGAHAKDFSHHRKHSIEWQEATHQTGAK